MKKIGLFKLLSTITLAAAGVLGIANIKENFQVKEIEIVEAAQGKATKDYPMIVNCYGDLGSGFFDGCDVGLHCWGGDLTTAKTVKIDKLTNHMGVGIIPKGTQYFQVYRAGSGQLPCDDIPATIHNQWGQWPFDSGKNVVTIKSWAGDQEYNDNKAVLFKDMPVMFDINPSISGWWLSSDATTYAVAIGNLNNWYDYTHTESWHSVTRIGSTGYVYFTPSSTIICDGVVVSRNQLNKTGWNNKWNQSTDMYVSYGFNSLYTTQVESGKTGDNYNWGNKSADETASEYGCYFMDKITCSGSGNITSAASNWGLVKSFYQSLTKDVQGAVWLASGNETGSNIEKAMYRYDYIVFFKQYEDYDDFIDRAKSSGRTFKSSQVMSLLFGEKASTSVVLITVVSLVSVSAIGGYFFLRRRKTQ